MVNDKTVGRNPFIIHHSAFIIFVTSSWSSPECSPRCQRGDRGFESRRGRLGKA